MTAEYTLVSILERNALSPATAGRPAFTQGAEVRTFADLYANANRFAHALLELGVGKGDRVGVLMGNRLEWLEALFAITSIGAVCLPVNVLLTGHDVNTVLQNGAPRVLIVDEHAQAALHSMTAVPGAVVTVGHVDVPPGIRTHTYKDLLLFGVEEAPQIAVSGTEPAMIYYTSGTTSAPKAVFHTHQRVLWNAQHQMSDLALRDDEKYLVVPSFSWSAGLHHITLAQLWTGGCSEVLPTGSATLKRVVDTVERAGIARAFLAPTLLKQLAEDHELLERVRVSSLNRVMSGAEPLPPSLVSYLHQALPSCSITQAYGMTEMPLIAACIEPGEARAHPASTGRASTIATVAVRRSDGRVAFEGEGEILLRSPATTTGYVGNEAATDQAFRDGWFHTGDSGRLDPSGLLTVTGRTKDVIITGGINLYPSEVEEVILRLPGVVEAAVIGVPDDRWGERPMAVVVTGASHPLTESEVMRHCARSLSAYKRPSQVLVRTAPLPKTVTGKILKRGLRAELAGSPQPGADPPRSDGVPEQST
ncbi:class I adenylate-forming enzyme family protein [Streptomyces sp. NPDC086777]|uniref:class I adenylate-forming enzyme family protein n=1 Tax=Streptomyces sp. NPDC086777 TaxID=3154866 RepID=UPI00344B62A9